MNNYNYQPVDYDFTNPNQGPNRQRDINPEDERFGKGFAIASLVFGLFALILCWAYGIGAIFGIAGIVFSAISAKKGNISGMRRAGLVLSIIGTVIGCIFGIPALAVLILSNSY